MMRIKPCTYNTGLAIIIETGLAVKRFAWDKEMTRMEFARLISKSFVSNGVSLSAGWFTSTAVGGALLGTITGPVGIAVGIFVGAVAGSIAHLTSRACLDKAIDKLFDEFGFPKHKTDDELRRAKISEAFKAFGFESVHDVMDDEIFTKQKICKEYHLKALECHPDRMENGGSKQAFLNLYANYQVLMDVYERKKKNSKWASDFVSAFESKSLWDRFMLKMQQEWKRMKRFGNKRDNQEQRLLHPSGSLSYGT